MSSHTIPLLRMQWEHFFGSIQNEHFESRIYWKPFRAEVTFRPIKCFECSPLHYGHNSSILLNYLTNRNRNIASVPFLYNMQGCGFHIYRSPEMWKIFTGFIQGKPALYCVIKSKVILYYFDILGDCANSWKQVIYLTETNLSRVI